MTPFANWMSSSISCPRVIDRVVLDLDLASLAMFSEKLLSAFTGMATYGLSDQLKEYGFAVGRMNHK